MSEQTYSVAGMTCSDCARHIERALKSLPEVLDAAVAFPEGKARVQLREALALERLNAVLPKPYRLAAPNRAFGPESGTPLLRGLTDLFGRRKPVQRDDRSGKAKSSGGLHIAIIGSGSAAMAAAIRAVQEGARVTMIEQGTVGGTCVNIGCVPSKILIRAAHLAHEAAHHPFAGLAHTTLAVDRPGLVAQQQARVRELRAAKYQKILDEHADHIAFVRGQARFKTASVLEITRADGKRQELSADRVLIATGARPAVPPIPGLAGTPFWTSTEALVAEDIPQQLIVLGGSVVGLELGQAFRRLGAEVTVLELLDRLLPIEDEDISQGLRAALEDEGIAVHTGFKSESVRYQDGRFEITGNGRTVAGDRLLVATGRRPNTDGLGLEAIGVKLGTGGAIEVNEQLQTSVPNVYAAGDCTSAPQFVYVAAAAGTRAVVNMLGGAAALDLSTMPAVVFTDPQVATVGLNERAAREQGREIETRTLTLDHVPRALANFDTRGFIKLVAERASGRLLGAQILASEAGEMIEIAVLAIRHSMTVEALGNELFPYLVMAEGLKLCAQTFTRDVAQLSCCAG
jgi:mercuric reductase